MVRLLASFVALIAVADFSLSSPLVLRDNGLVIVPFTKKAPFSKTAQQLLQRNQARLAVVFNNDRRRGGNSTSGDGGGSSSSSNGDAGNAPATNEDDTYIVQTTVGDQTFNLIVDTGSSNTWVGAGTTYKPGSSATDTGAQFSVTYGSGSVSGNEFIDTVTLGSLTVQSQSIGDGTQTTGFDGVDGIVGFGPVDLTSGTVSDQDTVPTFMDNLLKQGTISSEVLGVSFQPLSGSDDSDINGELSLGGFDSSKFTGDITFVPRTDVSPFSSFWGISVSSLALGQTTISETVDAIVDTGTTLIFIPTSAYNAFLDAAGGVTDRNTGLASFSEAPTDNFVFTISGSEFSLTPSQYLIPEAQFANFGIPSGSIVSWISDGGNVAANVNFIIGQKFLENFYSVFDTSNNRVGLATAA